MCSSQPTLALAGSALRATLFRFVKRLCYSHSLLIGIVTAWNLQAAFLFIFSPAGFVRAYELSGVSGEAAVRGIGILFLMWNIPYLFALVDPIRHRLILTICLLMQLTGLAGETYILFTLPSGHEILSGSILRFIFFDGIGLVLLTLVWLMNRRPDFR